MFNFFKKKPQKQVYSYFMEERDSSDLIEKMMESGDSNYAHLVIAIFTIVLSFKDAEKLIQSPLGKSFKNSNIDIIALEFFLLYINSAQIYIEKIEDEKDDYIDIDDDDEYNDGENIDGEESEEEVISETLAHSTNTIFTTYSKYYDEEYVKKRIISSIDYKLNKKPMNEIFAARLYRCAGALDFREIKQIKTSIIDDLGIFSHSAIHYTHMIPAYMQSLGKILAHYYDYALPDLEDETP